MSEFVFKTFVSWARCMIGALSVFVVQKKAWQQMDMPLPLHHDFLHTASRFLHSAARAAGRASHTPSVNVSPSIDMHA